MSKKSKCICDSGSGFPINSDGFSRRRFVQIAGTGLVASYFAPVLNAAIRESATGVAPALRNSAKNCIMIFLGGAPSHVDTWDLKEGVWTPTDFAPTDYGALRLPQGLMPNTAEHFAKLAIIRSGLAWAAEHGLATTWAQMARNPFGATGSIAPHIGAVVALESEATRKAGDILPGFISLNRTKVGNGYLPARVAPFNVQPAAAGLSSLSHPDGQVKLNERYALLDRLDTDRGDDETLGRDAASMATSYEQAKTLVDSPDANKYFSYTTDEFARYGSSGLGGSMIIARNLIGARRGTRFVQVTHGGWDNHANIYAKPAGIYAPMKQFDPAFGALLTDLAAMPGSRAGVTVLDETLVVVVGEFGRSVGALNTQAGRDHFTRMSIVFAGGGVKGGRVIGSTDAEGRNVKEFGWAANRDVRPEDVTSSIYSALGIDYTTVRHDDPLNRGFEYVPFSKDGTYGPVNELFS